MNKRILILKTRNLTPVFAFSTIFFALGKDWDFSYDCHGQHIRSHGANSKTAGDHKSALAFPGQRLTVGKAHGFCLIYAVTHYRNEGFQTGFAVFYYLIASPR